MTAGNVTAITRQRGRIIDREARDQFVYWIYDADGRVLYIGCTRVPESRWRSHKQTNPGLVAAAARIQMRGPYKFDVARTIERSAIYEANPLFNMEKDKHHKLAAVQDLNERARLDECRAFLSRYGIEAAS